MPRMTFKKILLVLQLGFSRETPISLLKLSVRFWSNQWWPVGRLLACGMTGYFWLPLLQQLSKWGCQQDSPQVIHLNTLSSVMEIPRLTLPVFQGCYEELTNCQGPQRQNTPFPPAPFSCQGHSPDSVGQCSRKS